MVSEVVDFEYIITRSETEAFLLEHNFIKEYRPHYNILLMDDKTYPYICLTKETHPRLIVTRDVKVSNKKNRGKLFMKEAEECGLDIYPYSGGFFITVFSDDGLKFAEELKKVGIYVLGFKKAIRISICSVPKFELIGLAKRIKDQMK